VDAPLSSKPVFVTDPAAHLEQLLSKADPVVLTYRPAIQPMHVVARFDAVEYCPTTQAVHVVAPVLLPVSVTEPAAQSLHEASADLVEYFPATHSTHELKPLAVLRVIEPAVHTLQSPWPAIS
jgi:hypothetical protein